MRRRFRGTASLPLTSRRPCLHVAAGARIRNAGNRALHRGGDRL